MPSPFSRTMMVNSVPSKKTITLSIDGIELNILALLSFVKTDMEDLNDCCNK